MKKIVAIAVLLGAILSSCSGVKNLSEQGDTQLNTYTEGALSYKEQFRFKYLFFEAQRLKSVEEYDKAVELMEQCVAVDPTNAAAHYEMAQLYVRVEQLENALFHAKQAKEGQPDNIWVHHLLAQLHQVMGDFEGELQAYQEMARLDPNNVEYQYYLAIAYTRASEFKKALQVYNKLEKSIGINEELSIKKEHLYIVMGDVDKAALELQNLIQFYPNEIRYRGMLAELYHANDRAEEAIAIYREILKIDPSEPRSNMALAEYYRLQNDYERAFEYLDHSFEDANFDVDVKFQILVTYFELALKEESFINAFFSLVEKAIKAHPNQASFHAIKGDLYFQKNQAANAYEAYGMSLKLGATEFVIWNRYLILGLEMQAYQVIMKEGLKAIETHPIQPTMYLFTGLAYSFSEQEEEAVRLLKKGVNYVVNNRPLKAEFFNYLADAYHKLEEHDLSDNYYEKSLDLVPENPLVLNNYSYYLSLRSEELAKAERLSKKCLELSPDEATYQDTYGWILFKLKRFEEAEVWLKKSLENGGAKSAVIVEHYGDVLYKLDKKVEAQRYWQQAQQMGAASEILNKKAREGILYE